MKKIAIVFLLYCIIGNLIIASGFEIGYSDLEIKKMQNKLPVYPHLLKNNLLLKNANNFLTNNIAIKDIEILDLKSEILSLKQDNTYKNYGLGILFILWLIENNK